MPADPGLFGPDSISWRVHGDPSVALAGFRALLLQALHPLAIAGVEQHSGFREDPWGRLVRTAEFIGVATYGTVEQAERAAARVRGIHRRVRGVDVDTGREYRADDPDLLRWVHCSEIDSLLNVYRRSGGRISDAEADAYVAEQTRAAALVGLDPTSVPASVAELTTYLDQIRPELRVTPAARRTATFLLFPPMPSRLVGIAGRPAWAGLASVGFALLPRWARRMYSLPGLPTTDIGASIAARAVRTSLLAVPPSLRDGPHVKAARARLASPSTGSRPRPRSRAEPGRSLQGASPPAGTRRSAPAPGH